MSPFVRAEPLRRPQPKTSISGANRSVKSCRSVNCINQWNVQRLRSSTGESHEGNQESPQRSTAWTHLGQNIYGDMIFLTRFITYAYMYPSLIKELPLIVSSEASCCSGSHKSDQLHERAVGVFRAAITTTIPRFYLEQFHSVLVLGWGESQGRLVPFVWTKPCCSCDRRFQLFRSKCSSNLIFIKLRLKALKPSVRCTMFTSYNQDCPKILMSM